MKKSKSNTLLTSVQKSALTGPSINPFMPGDNFGREIGRRPRSRSQTSEAGYPGLESFGGYVTEEFIHELRGKRGVYFYEEMRRNDPVVGSMLHVAEQLIHNASIIVVAAEDNPKAAEAEKAKHLVKTSLVDMVNTWPDTLSEILTMLPFGWSYCAVVHKRREGWSKNEEKSSMYNDGAYGWNKISLRGHSSLNEWIFDKNGNTTGMVQLGPPSYQMEIVPKANAAHFRTSTEKNNPEGISVLRNAWRPYVIKKRLEETEMIGVERDLAGLPMLQTPEGLDIWNTKDEHAAATLARAENIVRLVRLDKYHGLVLPFGWEFSLQTTPGQRAHNTADIISRWDQRIAVTMLADMLLIGHEKVGSFALVQSKTRLFSSALESYAARIAGVFNRHLIPRMMILNGIPQEYWPTVKFGPVETPPLAELGEYMKSIHGIGVEIDDNIAEYLRRVAQLPLPEKGDKLVSSREEIAEMNKPPAPPGEGNKADGKDDPKKTKEMAEKALAVHRKELDPEDILAGRA